MWTARETELSRQEHGNRQYNYFKDHMGYIGNANTLQELIDYIRNPEDGYKNLHLENTTGTDDEADEYGVKYYLKIQSLCYGYYVEFAIYDLDDIDGCNDLAKEELIEIKELLQDNEE